MYPPPPPHPQGHLGPNGRPVSAANDPSVRAHVYRMAAPGHPQGAVQPGGLPHPSSGLSIRQPQGLLQAGTGQLRTEAGPVAAMPAPHKAQSKTMEEDAHVVMPGVAKHMPRLWERDVLSLLALALALTQALGTLGEIGFKPGIFIHGGLGRLVDYASDKAWVPQWLEWLELGGNWAVCAFWCLLAVASSRFVREEAPGFDAAREQQWLFIEKRRAYVWPFLVLVASHAAGAWLAFKGWWWAAIPLELTGHATMAFLLYVAWVPEARQALVVVVDMAGRGHNSRLSFSQTDQRFSFTRRWDTVRHDHLSSAVLGNSLFSRLMGTGHLELQWRPQGGSHTHTLVLKGIGSKKEVSQLAGFLNGPFREGKPLYYTHPSTLGTQPR